MHHYIYGAVEYKIGFNVFDNWLLLPSSNLIYLRFVLNRLGFFFFFETGTSHDFRDVENRHLSITSSTRKPNTPLGVSVRHLLLGLVA